MQQTQIDLYEDEDGFEWLRRQDIANYLHRYTEALIQLGDAAGSAARHFALVAAAFTENENEN